MSHQINYMLTNIPKAEFQTLADNMQLVSLEKGINLFDKSEIIQYIYFPTGAIVSMLSDLEDGTSVEVYSVNMTCPR
jgi:CRP-like cAMP-binding protein